MTNFNNGISRPKRSIWRIVIPIILTGLVVLGVRLAINANNYTNQTNQLIASLQPTPSVYNTKLQNAVDADTLQLAAAKKVLGDADYLAATQAYADLDNAIVDAQTSLGLAGAGQLSTLTKEDYLASMRDLDSSFAAVQTAQQALEAQVAATPAPAPAPATPAPAN